MDRGSYDHVPSLGVAEATELSNDVLQYAAPAKDAIALTSPALRPKRAAAVHIRPSRMFRSFCRKAPTDSAKLRVAASYSPSRRAFSGQIANAVTKQLVELASKQCIDGPQRDESDAQGQRSVKAESARASEASNVRGFLHQQVSRQRYREYAP